MSRTRFAVIVISACMAGGGLSARQAPAGDLDGMQGVWTVVTVEMEGRYLPDEEAAKYKVAIAKDKLVFIMPGREIVAEFKLDPKAKPKTIDLVSPDDKRLVPLGIYEFAGDALKISFVEPGSPNRPTKFVTEERVRNVVLFTERRKPAAGDKSAEELIKHYEENVPRQASANNLRQLALGMHNYYNDYNGFISAISDKGGKPLLSWRVAILPYLGEDQLYKQFKLDEPWDGPTNKPLLEKMPRVFAPVRGLTKEPFATYYRVFVSPADAKPCAMFVGHAKTTFATVSDGSSNTLLIAEARDAIPWTKPDELVYDPKKPLPKLGGLFAGGFHACFADGSTAFFGEEIYKDEPMLHALITRNGGEAVDARKYVKAR